jgi:hypothetical protein
VSLSWGRLFKLLMVVIFGKVEVVKVCWQKYKEEKLEVKIRALNNVIVRKFVMEDDIDVFVGKIAISLSHIRKDNIFNK